MLDVFLKGIVGGFLLMPFALLAAYLQWRKKQRIDARRQSALNRLKAGDAGVDDINTTLSRAAQLEREGAWHEALSLYESAADALRDKPNGEYAASCADRVRQRLQRPL